MYHYLKMFCVTDDKAGYKTALIWYKDGSQTAQVNETESSVNIALAELNLAVTFP